MLEYIKEHWIAYLVGATIAVLLGLGLSFFLGEKFSTPDSVRAARAAADDGVQVDLGEIDFGDEGGSDVDQAPADQAPAEGQPTE